MNEAVGGKDVDPADWGMIEVPAFIGGDPIGLEGEVGHRVAHEELREHQNHAVLPSVVALDNRDFLSIL